MSEVQSCVREKIIAWFVKKSHQWKVFNWDIPTTTLFEFMMPSLYDSILTHTFISAPEELNDKFIKFFATNFKMRKFQSKEKESYSFAETFIFVLSGTFQLSRVPKRVSISGQAQTSVFREIIPEWNAIKSKNDSYSQCLKLSSLEENSVLLYCERNSLEKFYHENIKEDREKKISFFQTFLFSGKPVSFPVNSIQKVTYKRGSQIQLNEESIFLIYEGSAALHLIEKSDRSKNWKFTLVRGAILSLRLIDQITDNKTLMAEQFMEKYFSQKCILLSIPVPDFTRALRNDRAAEMSLLQKIESVVECRKSIMVRNGEAQSVMKESEEGRIEIDYSIPRNHHSRVLRRRNRSQQVVEYQDFMTINKFEKITCNKEKVETKHTFYADLMSVLKQKEKNKRFQKMISTQEGLKEIKKTEYLTKWKKIKIEHLVIKESITNREKLKQRTNEINGIFENKLNDDQRHELRKTLNAKESPMASKMVSNKSCPKRELKTSINIKETLTQQCDVKYKKGSKRSSVALRIL